ncbi:tRNA dihydrouridine synthase DusB [Desulfobacterales bacterium HSG16]|nr:tRNA dihydrouridine synthase DusB [Desulfobacterales bacterium HSG16]
MMKIGSVTIDNHTVMAPLAGITNLPFRLLVKKSGCGLVCTEMISAHGLFYDSRKTFKMLESDPFEKPVSVQIFGSDPEIMAGAAVIAASCGADILDVNFGCSVRKILKTGSGSALMKNPGQASALLSAIRKAISIPLTIKIRSGWDASGNQAVEIAKIAESCGVDAIAVHPRTATQGFRGKADWSIIEAVKKEVNIPVIGNGDIENPEDALKMTAMTGCDGVMVGRAAIGKPWIFSRILSLSRGEVCEQEDFSLHFKAMIRYLDASVKYIGEVHACRMMRSRLGWFVKGLPCSSRFRESIKRIDTHDTALDIIYRYMESIGIDPEHFSQRGGE